MTTYDALSGSRGDGTQLVRLYRLEPGAGEGSFPVLGFTDYHQPITFEGLEYQPWPVTSGRISGTSSTDRQDVTVRFARGSALDSLLVPYPPSVIIRLVMREGHATFTSMARENWPAFLFGQLRSAVFTERNELEVSVFPSRTSMQVPGLRRNYQLGCPHQLYGQACGAAKAVGQFDRGVASISGRNVTVMAPLGTEIPQSIKDAMASIGKPNHFPYTGGMARWMDSLGNPVLRTITKISSDGLTISLRGPLSDLSTGSVVTVFFGCQRSTQYCRDVFNNIDNFGGQPFIPIENPLSMKNIFY